MQYRIREGWLHSRLSVISPFGRKETFAEKFRPGHRRLHLASRSVCIAGQARNATSTKRHISAQSPMRLQFPT